MMFTIIGASGFIGSHLLAHLNSQGAECFAPRRGERDVFGCELGHVIYCAGLTADFREHPLDAVEAHVAYLLEILRGSTFDSLLYLSSTRVYAGATGTAEDARLAVSPLDADQLYNLSKLTGEAVCFAAPRGRVRVVRLSNVYGLEPASENFLNSLIRDALNGRRPTLNTTLDSAKDYISVDDVTRLLPDIAARGRERIYNLAAGANVTNAEIVEVLGRATGCRFQVDAAARRVIFPEIDTRRVKNEYGFVARSLIEALPGLVDQYKGMLSA